MRSALHVLVVVSLAACTIAGCASEAASPADLQAAGASLQRKGVYYLEAMGTADNPTLTFYDQSRTVIGGGQSSRNSQLAAIQWRGNSWERTDGAFHKNGADASAPSDLAELDNALSVFELGLDQAFPPSAALRSDQAHASSCGHPTCSRPNHRCVGACAGYVCSDPHIGGHCELPGPSDKPTPEP
jgi:hypothetical protein